jgi:phosphopantothenoylcysteine decarboxylase / phosphopantothenate---cysteine ligase
LAAGSILPFFMSLAGKKILLGVTGSIAAYKSAVLTRLLVKAGAELRVVITPAARDFVTPLTLSTLSRHPVWSDISNEAAWNNHVEAGRWADIMLIAPLSCNTLAKMSQGLCDNLLLAIYLSATCPVVVAPAMDEDMWKHPSTRANLEKISSYGNHIIPVEHGELASGLVGPGRMAEPETIVSWLETYFAQRELLRGKKILITAGPTYEPLDPVRFIGNHSTGKMGVALAREAARRGASVHLVLGPVQLPFELDGIRVHRVQSAAEMYEAATRIFPEADMAIMSAAVADYTPVAREAEKIKKTGESLTMELVKTKDILKALGGMKQKHQFLIGFALETTREKEYALKKLKDKNADMIVLNSLRDAGAGFGHDTNKITIFDAGGGEKEFDARHKNRVAADILDRMQELTGINK